MPSSNKLVSVIIPTYNSADYLVEAIESVLSQKLPQGYSLEVIVVNDGSSDNTSLMLEPLLKKITYIEIAHVGRPSIPRNVALSVAKGDLIAFQDSDDIWLPDKLLSQLEAFNDPDTQLTYGNAEVIDTARKKLNKTVLAPKEIADGESFEGLVLHNAIPTLTVVMRRSVLDAIGNFNESPDLSVGEDYELWLRVAASFPKGIKCISKIMALHRHHTQSISSGSNLQAIDKIIKTYNIAWDNQDLNEKQRALLEDALYKAHQNWTREMLASPVSHRPVVSVVMGVYNGGPHLRLSIDSILNQTFKDFEFIIIDDGSSDESIDIVRAANDPRIRLVRQVNHKLIYTLNKGIELASGQYIARQDADDISLPSRFEKELQLLTSNQRLGVVGSYFTYIDEDTMEPSITIASPNLNLDIKRAMYFNNPFGHGTVMIRRKVFEKTKPYSNDYLHIEDFELWCRIADNWEMGIVPESLYLYRLSANGISKSNSDLQEKVSQQLFKQQWAKPFIYKSPDGIAKDAVYYRSMHSLQAKDVYQIYLSQQVDIASILLRKGIMRAGIKTASAANKLDPDSWKKFVRPAIHGILKRLGAR